METYIAYFDETGDDGATTASSTHFVLTSIYMPANKWQENYHKAKDLRKTLRDNYGFHVSQEMHTKHFLTDKNPYRNYGWSKEEKQEILKAFTITLAKMDLQIINVVIDKNHFKDDKYSVLENALKYNIQRIENDSAGQWNYLIITDQGRIAPMRKTARAIRAFNPIQSKYSNEYSNQPIANLLEDILEKDSAESYFIQFADFVSYFVHLYYLVCYEHKELPNRVKNVVDPVFINRVLVTLKESKRLNLKASEKNEFGLVIYPKA